MQLVKTITEKLFVPLAFLLRPPAVQRWVRKLGVPLPYFLAKQLRYDEVVDFKVGDTAVYMQSQNTPIEITIFWKGVFNGREGAELRVWHALCQQVGVALDVGANTGIYSLIAGTNPRCQVHAFEPVPLVHTMLTENITLNHRENIFAHQLVVSDMVGETTLYIPTDGWVDVASIEAAFAERFVDNQGLREITCATTTVDAFLKTITDSGPVLIKIDVEGAEPHVLRGLRDSFIERDVYILMEILNAEVFATVTSLIPDSYTLLGVVQEKPFYQPIGGYQKGIKNYLLLPDAVVDTLPQWLESTD